MSEFSVDRRRLLQLLSIGVACSRVEAQTCTNASHELAAEAKPYTAQFFSAEELGLLDRAMEAILPADEHSPGGHEAEVALYADLIVFHSPDDVKGDWRAGLRMLKAELEHSSITDWMDGAAANEREPRSALDLFFIKLKQTTVEGYYTSRIGIKQELQYQGNEYMKEFKGCAHEEHTPAGVPVLGGEQAG